MALSLKMLVNSLNVFNVLSFYQIFIQIYIKMRD